MLIVGDSGGSPNDLLAQARRRLRSPSGSGRELSRHELAEAVNAYLWTSHRARDTVDATYVGHLEQGRYRWPRQRRREAFRHVLGVATDADIGFYINRGIGSTAETVEVDPIVVGTDRSEDVIGDVKRRVLLAPLAAAVVPHGGGGEASALVAALTSYHVPEQSGQGAGAGHVCRLARRVALVRGDYQHSHYGAALRHVPGLIVALNSTAASDDDSARQLAVMTAQTYQVASGLLLKSDDPVMASLAADRSITAAHRSGDPLTVASSMRAVVHTLLASGYPKRAAHLAVSAAEHLDHVTRGASTGVLSLYGALLLRGAIAAGRDEDRQRAVALLDEASAVAAKVGHDGNACWTAFGPTNVLLHRVAVAVQLGYAGTAVDIAATVNLAAVQIPERRASLMIDTARAFTQWGKYDRALDAIRAAERVAPEEVRSRRSVHDLIGDITRRSPAPVQRRAREYAETVGAVV